MADDEKAKTHKVVVVVSKREGHNGVWAVGKHFPNESETELELTDEQIAIVASKPNTVVLKGGRIAKPSGSPGTALGLAPDEEAALAEYRAAKAKNPKLAEQYGARAAGKPVTFEKGDVNEALAAQSGQVSGAADAPVENSDILHGKPPEAPVASSSQPLGTSTSAGKDSSSSGKRR